MALDASGLGQIQDFLDVLKRRRWQVILPALFITTLGLAFAVVVPKKVQVSTRIELKEARNEQDYALKNPVNTATQKESKNAEFHIKNFERIRLVIGEEEALWGDFFKLDPEGRAEFIRGVMDELVVDVHEKPKSGGSTFIDIDYADVDGLRAEKFLTDLTAKWVDDVVERDKQSLETERETLQDQMNDANQVFQDINQKYFDLCGSLGIDPRGNNRRSSSSRDSGQDAFYTRLNELKALQDDKKIEADELVKEIEELQDLYDLEPEMIDEPEKLAAVGYEKEVGKWRLKIMVLKEQQARLTPANSKWKTIETEIEELESQIRLARDLATPGGTTTNLVPNPARKVLSDQIALRETELLKIRAALRTVAKQIREKDLQVQARVDLYRDLSNVEVELESARQILQDTTEAFNNKSRSLEVLTEAYGDPFEISEKPNSLGAPTTPSGGLIVTFSALFGAIIGLLVALAAEFGGNTYRSSSDVANVMTVPVLGTVNAIITTAELRRAQLSRTLVAASTFIIIGGLSYLTWAWVFAKEKLPTDVVQMIEDIQLKLM